MVLRHPPFSEEAPGIIAIIRVGRVRQQSRRGRCSIRGFAGPGEGTQTIIHDKLIGESEKIIIMNRGYQSHLMRRRRWFIGMFSSGTSSAARLPRFSSSAMKLIKSTGREKGRYRVLRGRRKAEKQERLQVYMCSRPEPLAGI